MSSQQVELCGNKAQADVTGKALVVNLDWSFGDDLDLGVLCVDRQQAKAILIYHDNEGARARSPFVHLAHKSEGDGRRKSRREHVVITDRTQHGELYLCIWDQDATREGREAAFAQNPDSYWLTVTDRQNKRIRLHREAGSAANCLVLGRIWGDTVEAMEAGAKLKAPVSSVDEVIGLALEDRERRSEPQ